MITSLQHRRFLVQYAKNLSVAKLKLPLPLGEGWGEGLAHRRTAPTSFSLCSLRCAPSPWPSPRGRGNKKGAYQGFFGALFMVLWLIAGANAALAQSSSFTYQGRLTDGGTSANGNYDLQFALWDSLGGGTQVGSTQTLNTVAVSNGVFTVSLDFGANAFPGASRFLEIGARPSGGGSFTLLSPRQQITSTPYAVRSLNASSADSVPPSGVPAGSGSYIQNTASPQSASNFNISGNGTAGGTLSGNLVNATTQYNLNGSRILSAPGTANLFAGFLSGALNTTGFQNTFFGSSAGTTNKTGNDNSFFGTGAGQSTTGSQNSFFGSFAGAANTTGSQNAFFGRSAGPSNTVGGNNTFVGASAGDSNTEGSANTFIGIGAGFRNTTGSNNVFVGGGNNNTTGSANIIIGLGANLGSGNLFNATAIGSHALVDASSSLVLGNINGVNNANDDTKVGIGTTAPAVRLHVVGTTGLIGNVGIGTTSPDRTLTVAGRARISSIPQEPSGASLCFDINGNLLQCGASSLKWKTNVCPFRSGLDIIQRLRPISFNWKQDGRPDIGLGAEDVAKVAPSFTFTDDKGEVTGVKYERLSMLLINAIKEQQAQIEKQQSQIAGLKKLVCRSRRRARVCR